MKYLQSQCRILFNRRGPLTKSVKCVVLDKKRCDKEVEQSGTKG